MESYTIFYTKLYNLLYDVIQFAYHGKYNLLYDEKNNPLFYTKGKQAT